VQGFVSYGNVEVLELLELGLAMLAKIESRLARFDEVLELLLFYNGSLHGGLVRTSVGLF